MPRNIEWEIPAEIQPKPEDCAFDLDSALGAVLGLQATVPEDAFTAGTLGTERAGSAVLIRKDGLVLTIGYLITEAESIWSAPATRRSSPPRAAAGTRLPRPSSPARNSPAIGNTCSTAPSSPRRRTRSGAAPR